MSKEIQSVSDIISTINNLGELSSILYFTQKSRSGYTTYAPNVSPSIKDQILELIVQDLKKYESYQMKKYSPLGCDDETIEFCKSIDIGGYNEAINSFKDCDRVETDIDADQLTFYTLMIENELNDVKIYFFRRVTKFKRLSSNGIMAYFQGYKLVNIESKMLGIDGLVDVIVIKNDAYVINHISLERIFKMTEQYNEVAIKALDILKSKNKIMNFKQFEDDCLNDMRIQKTLTKIMAEPDVIEHAFDNFDEIEKTIDMFQLDLDVVYEQGEKKLCYSESSKELLMRILYIIRDAYYTSTIQHRKGIDDSR